MPVTINKTQIAISVFILYLPSSSRLLHLSSNISTFFYFSNYKFRLRSI